MAALALGLLAAGCSRGPAHPWQAAATPTLWPLPPVPPRIRYEGAITAGQTLRFSKGWSLLDLLAGRPKITLTSPHGIAVDPQAIVIADSARAVVHVLDLAGRRYRHMAGAKDGPFRCPIGVALDGQGSVFVSDAAWGKVFRFSLRGRQMEEIEGKFIRPAGLAFDRARGQLHVVDAGAHAVLTYRWAGERFERLRRLGGRDQKPGGFNFPTHAAVDRAGRLYVSDSMNHRVQIFDAEGKRLGTFGQAGDGSGDFAKAKGIAIDSEGHIYVVDSLYDVVQVFDRQGRLLLVFGGRGKDDGSLWLPTGICIDGKDRIYVADSGNSRVQVYQYLAPRP
ncbi:6-bladed beta-propeller [bacterium]|nr:6-bladed beta-propeller [bacterium]